MFDLSTVGVSAKVDASVLKNYCQLPLPTANCLSRHLTSLRGLPERIPVLAFEDNVTRRCG